jgi:hypothetical protein
MLAERGLKIGIGRVDEHGLKIGIRQVDELEKERVVRDRVVRERKASGWRGRRREKSRVKGRVSS